MDIDKLIGVAMTIGIGIISFFLKRAFSELDNNRKEIKSLSERFATKEEVKAITDRIDKIENGIEFLKENNVRKDDFLRNITGIYSKLDELTLYLRDKI